MFRKKIRLRRRIILALAVAAAIVPSAQARVDQGSGSPPPDRPSVAELLFDVNRAIAALDREERGSLALDRKADVFVPQPSPGRADDSGWFELGAGAGIGIAAALLGAALALEFSRRRPLAGA